VTEVRTIGAVTGSALLMLRVRVAFSIRIAPDWADSAIADNGRRTVTTSNVNRKTLMPRELILE